MKQTNKLSFPPNYTDRDTFCISQAKEKEGRIYLVGYSLTASSLGRSLLGWSCLQDCLDTFKTLPPRHNLVLDCSPLLFFQFNKHVALNHDLFIELVNFCVDDFVLDCLDGPLLNFCLVNVEQLTQLGVLIVSF